MMFMYDYDIRYYDEESRQSRAAMGFVAATSWNEAVTKIVDYYGEDLVYDIRCRIMDNTEEGIIERTNAEVDEDDE